MASSADIETKVISALEGTGVPYEVVECDPDFADTAAFCQKYGYPLASCGNTITVASKRPRGKYAACVVKGSDRLDVNRRVRGLMGVSKLSFASPDETVAVTGMLIGGVTPFALPPEVPVYVDQKLMELDHVILGSGSRSSKIKISPDVFRKTPSVEIVAGLSLEPSPEA